MLLSSGTALQVSDVALGVLSFHAHDEARRAGGLFEIDPRFTLCARAGCHQGEAVLAWLSVGSSLYLWLERNKVRISE